jgi:hypothetical protein
MVAADDEERTQWMAAISDAAKKVQKKSTR